MTKFKSTKMSVKNPKIEHLDNKQNRLSILKYGKEYSEISQKQKDELLDLTYAEHGMDETEVKIAESKFLNNESYSESNTDKNKKEVEDYLNKSSAGLEGKQWYTITTSNHNQGVDVYRGQGLDMERDGIDEEDLNEDYDYMEVSEDELRDLLKNKRVYNWRLMN